MADMTKWPDIPKGLVDYLRAVFPPKCKVPSESIEEHMLYAGQAKLAQTISIEYERQQKAKYDIDEEDED